MPEQVGYISVLVARRGIKCLCITDVDRGFTFVPLLSVALHNLQMSLVASVGIVD